MANETLNDLAIKERREYYKKWRANNKDKVRKSNQNYWKRRAEKRLQEEAKNA